MGNPVKPRLVLLALPLLLAACGGKPDAPVAADPVAQAPAREKEPDENVEKDPLLSEAKIAHVVVPEAFITPATPAENVDSPASWRAPDGTRWLIATAKDTHRLVVYDGSTGKQLRTVSGPGSELGQMQRPNGIAVTDDLVLVVERDNRRVQVFQLPDFTPLLVFGADDLKQPYGLWVLPQKDAYEVIVSDNYMSPQNEDLPPPLAELDQRFKRYPDL